MNKLTKPLPLNQYMKWEVQSLPVQVRHDDIYQFITFISFIRVFDIMATTSITDVDPKPTEYKFKSGDRVVLQSIKERPITGTVRWVGPMRLSREIGSLQIIAVGVETVSIHNYIYIIL